MTRAQMLAVVIQFRDVFKQAECTIPSAHLLAQLDAMELRLIDGEVPTEEWSQFYLQFTAFLGELMGSIEKRAAKIAMSADAHDRRDPQKFAHDANAQSLLKQWRTGGMRERIFGKLPIADRRELEELERQWREKPPGPAT